MASHSDNNLFKVLFIGDSEVGKSSILLRFTDNVFSSSIERLNGVDFKYRSLLIDDKAICLQIWDITGQQRFRPIISPYFTGAHGVVLVYDVTNRQSFQSIANWSQDIQTHCDNKNVSIFLVGNKCDDNSRRVVSFEEGSAIAREYGLPFLECSAKRRINIKTMFRIMTKNIYYKKLSEEKEDEVEEQDRKRQDRKGMFVSYIKPSEDEVEGQDRKG